MWHFMFLLKLSETWKNLFVGCRFSLKRQNFWSKILRKSESTTFFFVFAYLSEKASFRSREASVVHRKCPAALIRWHSWLLISLMDIIINSNGNWFNSISNTYRTCSELQLHFQRTTHNLTSFEWRMAGWKENGVGIKLRTWMGWKGKLKPCNKRSCTKAKCNKNKLISNM